MVEVQEEVRQGHQHRVQAQTTCRDLEESIQVEQDESNNLGGHVPTQIGQTQQSCQKVDT